MASAFLHQRARFISPVRRAANFSSPNRSLAGKKEADLPQKPSSKAELRDFLDIDFHGTFAPWAKQRMVQTWEALPAELNKDYATAWDQAQKLFSAATLNRRELLDALLRDAAGHKVIDILPYAQKTLSPWSAIDWIWETLYVAFSLCWDEPAENLVKALPVHTYDSGRLALRKMLVFAQFHHYPQALAILTSGVFKKSPPEIQCVADEFFALLMKHQGNK